MADQALYLRKKPHLTVLLILFFVSVSSSNAIAQVSGLNKDDRVRITAPTVRSGKIKGSVASLSGSVLTLSARDTLLMIPNSAIRQLEVPNGRRRALKEGIIIGAAAGALTFGILSAATNEPCSEEEWCFIEFSNSEAFFLGGITGLVIGGAAGAITGFLIKVDRWERAPLEFSMSVRPHDMHHLAVSPAISVRVSIAD